MELDSMKKLLLALTLALFPSLAMAQCNGVFANNTVCGNVTGSSNLPRPTNPSAFLGAAGGTNGQTQYNNGGALGGYTPSGDVTVNTATGVETIQPLAVTTGKINNAAVTNAKLVAGASGTYKGSADGATVTDIAVTGLLNTICTLLPSTCTSVLGYTNIKWYGAVCDGIFQSNQNFDYPATNISITSGLKALTSTGSTFTSADVGKRIYVPGAGVAGAGLPSTITAFTDATHVTINDAASTTVTAVAATNAAPFVYGTDDTTAIQAAATATPTGGQLFIPGQRSGCIIRQQGAAAYAILQDHPFSVRGTGHFSNLMTFPDMPTTVDNWFIDGTAGYDWSGVSWSGFSIGASNSFVPSTFIMYPRYGKRGIVLSDSPSANFVNVVLDNLTIGQSSNDYSVYIGNGTSSPSQTVTISRSKIYGGIQLELVADSFRITNNQLFGSTTRGGLFSFVSGAGKFEFSGNNVTWAGCTTINSGTSPSVINNYFEEVVTATSCADNALVNFNGAASTIASPIFVGNIVGALVSTTATPVRYNNSTGGIFGGNYISTSTVRTGVTSVVSLFCSAPNTWNGVGTHFSTALAAPNPFTC
jgi:hypothetical protein